MMFIWIHMVCTLLSYAAFLAGCVSAILFLIQERQLKHKHMGKLFHALPPLETLERLNFLAISIGFGLLSFGVVCGMAGASLLRGRWWSGDPKEYLTFTVWLAYFTLWVVRARATLRGRRVAVLSVFGFSLVLFTFLGATWLLPTWHAYL
jgi:ABC-type uncharacterized transport system permease subunit